MASRWERADRLDEELAATLEELAETRARLSQALSNPTTQLCDELRSRLVEMEKKYKTELERGEELERQRLKAQTSADALNALNATLQLDNNNLNNRIQQANRTIAELNTRLRQQELRPQAPAPQPQPEKPGTPDPVGVPRFGLLEID